MIYLLEVGDQPTQTFPCSLLVPLCTWL
jgi:hypothetical protein